ncbi:hypothetical protein K438DRAFT_967989 [Mycena galopus ATCC 62051]|nr:hypothetical protein K438DRAFT_967989 [Mycena galopus ATCC 62051]
MYCIAIGLVNLILELSPATVVGTLGSHARGVKAEAHWAHSLNIVLLVPPTSLAPYILACTAATERGVRNRWNKDCDGWCGALVPSSMTTRLSDGSRWLDNLPLYGP